MHQPKEIEAFLKIVCCNDSVRIFNHVWPKINKNFLELIVLLKIFLSKCKIDRAAVKTTTEHLPRENFFFSCLWEVIDIVKSLIMRADRLATKRVWDNSLVLSFILVLFLDLFIYSLPVVRSFLVDVLRLLVLRIIQRLGKISRSWKVVLWTVNYRLVQLQSLFFVLHVVELEVS